ncbi:MAG: hypothetical protein HY301_20335, partial [Verrucomicrobia bacterium]|nr:hypothetical protein [Verrucomicrobiota bacterium]
MNHPGTVVSALLATALAASAAPVDYAKEIKPLLTQHCVRCHGAAKPKGDLRADTAAA